MKGISLRGKKLLGLSLLLLPGLVLFSSCKTTKSTTVSIDHIREAYRTGYDDSTLAGNTLPLLMPYNKIIEPAGKIIRYGNPDLENHALDCVFDPQKKVLAVIDRYGLAFVNPVSDKIIDRLAYPDYKVIRRYENTFSGLTWYQHNDSLFVLTSVVDSRNSDSFVLMFSWNGRKARLMRTFPLKAMPPAPVALPNDLAVSYESSGDYLLVVCNGNNTLVKINLQTGEKAWIRSTGMVPYGLTVAGNKIYVTDWGGTRPPKGDTSVAGAPWGEIMVSKKTGAASSGSVSVLNLSDGRQITEIPVGLHPNAIISNKAGSRVYVANGNSDNISVINTSTNKVVDTIPVGLFRKGQKYYGDTPNALALSKDENTLFVANGMDNAIAVVSLGSPGNSKLEGFIPTEAYPSGLALDNENHIFVTNLEAEGARATVIDTTDKSFRTFHTAVKMTTAGFFNAHHMLASIADIPIPNAAQLKTYSAKVRKLNLAFRVLLTHKPPRTDVLPRPVPERIGEPSVFRHVIYIIKENRTYDQVMGDDKNGNGDPELCAFGKKVTPNEHKLAENFLLLDNYYASGKSSAEGHQWTDAAMTTDYVEKSVRGWFRSYPHVQKDAMVYSPSGFLWNNALDHGLSVRIYGEAATPHLKKGETWTDAYNTYQNGKDLYCVNTTTISRVAPVLSPSYPAFDSHRIPDVYRARTFINELHKYESEPGDTFPNLIIMALPDDHTAGMRPGFPTPRAMVADNDLALGRIIQAVTHSRFWPTTAIFITEDDSQDGWDHVSAYRTVGFVVSPYSHLKRTIHTDYNQTSMVRTIEQILGIPPMNMMDASALPMFDCFSSHQDLTPYTAVSNQIPLNEMNKDLSQLKGKAKHFAKMSMESQFDHIDGGNDDELNHIIWFSTMNGKPYPAAPAGDDDN